MIGNMIRVDERLKFEEKLRFDYPKPGLIKNVLKFKFKAQFLQKIFKMFLGVELDQVSQKPDPISGLIKYLIRCDPFFG